MSLSRPRTAVVAVVSALSLSACTGTPPGVAAQVGDERISDQQVDDFAAVLCSLGQLAGGEGGSPARSARLLSLQILVGDAIAAQVTDVESVEQTAVAAAVQELNAGRSSVPEHLQDTFDEVVAEYARAQNAVLELGRASLQESGQEGEISDQQAFAEGDRLRREYAQQGDVEVDPRFGTLEDGVVAAAEGSLSVPVSPLAVAGAAEELSPDFVSQLPATQKCS